MRRQIRRLVEEINISSLICGQLYGPNRFLQNVEQIAAIDAASLSEAAMIYGLFTPMARRHVVFRGSPVATRK